MTEIRPPSKITHSQFLVGAGVTEGLMLLAAFFLGWLMEFHPTEDLYWNWIDLGYGLLSTLPMLFVLIAMLLLPGSGIRGIREFLRDTLGPFLSGCRIIDLLLLAVLAGVCEEVLFRGFVYGYVRQFNQGLAILICNMAFGLAHLVTPLYAFLAAIAGLYLTALVAVDPSPNLLIPITAHAGYDFVVFLFVVHEFRRHVTLS
ncbi:MAG: CPBP family intramembrane metalloprotease [Fuerstiella sp.]|nr:CPBP family intramembrane metalloprotease [Fuerstiella sp.]